MSVFTDALNGGQSAHGGTISYFFSNQYANWNAYEIAQFEAGLQFWENVANITFTPAANAVSANFVFNNVSNSQLNTILNAPSNTVGILGAFDLPNGGGSQQEGWFNYQATGWDEGNTNGGLEQGGYGFITILHELGHGLGLEHPHNGTTLPGVSQGVDDDLGDHNYNQGINTLMSYNDGIVANGLNGASTPGYGWTGTPMAFDIAAIQELYGANTTFANGNNTYTLPNANQIGTFYEAIWDTGGIDTIRAQNGADALIDLNDASLIANDPNAGGVVSATEGIFGGFTIANGVVIENATGANGNDTLGGNEFENVLSGLSGNDTLRGEKGDDTLLGGNGLDQLFGGIGNDLLFGQAGNDDLFGEAGADNLNGGLGADHMDGGSGYDTVLYSYAAAGVTIDLLNGANNTGEAAGDTYLNIERYAGSHHDDTILGSNAADVLSGLGGDDTIDGRGGNDFLFGGAGGDHFIGGAHYDTVQYSNSATAITIDMSNGANGTGNAAGDTFDGVERIYATYYDDIVTGTSGNDNLVGLHGDDTLNGGGGNDILIGYLGADTLNGGAGFDTASYSFARSGVTVDLANTANNAGEAVGDSYNSIERIIASYRADTLIGSDGNDILVGLHGNDTINGGSGNDTIYGGVGADTLEGGTGIDTVQYSSATAAVTVDLVNNANNTGEAAGDTISGFENVVGSYHNDTLLGDAGNNSLYGINGDDTLNGGGGNDDLFGGNGNDTFVFEDNWGDDFVLDFDVAGTEKIDLQLVTGITDYNDLVANHLTYLDGDAIITDGANVITLVDVAGLLADDFII